MDLYCSKGKNCCYKFYWPSFGMAYGNPRFSELGNVLTKVALERSRMVLCSPDWGAHGGNEYWRTLLDRLTITSVRLPNEAIYVPLGRKTPIGKPGWRSMLSVVDGSLTSIPWEDLDSTLVQTIQRENDGLALGDLKDGLRPQDAIEAIPGGDEYVMTNNNAPNSPCHVSIPDGVTECGLSELPSSIHSDDETEHDAFFVQTCVEKVENAEYVAPLKRLLSLRGEEPLDEELDPRSRLREYVDSKRRLVAKKLCYAKPTRSSWPLKQGCKGDLSQLKEDLKQKITTWQREEDLKLMKSAWGAHVRTPEEDELSEECVYEPPRACLCCQRPPEMVERDLLYAYQGLKDTTKDEEPVEDHLPASITQGASNLHFDEDMEDKIKLLDPRVQKLIRTYLEVFGQLPPPASCEKLVQMHLKLKPEFVGHKIRSRPYPAPKEQADEIERQIQECIDAGLVLEYRDGDYPQHCSPCFLVAKPGSTAKRLVVDYGELNKKRLNHSGSIPNMESGLEKIASCRYKTKMDKRSGFWQVDLTPPHRHRRHRHHLHGGARRGRSATHLVPPPLKARTPGPRTAPDQARTTPESTSSVPAPLPALDDSPHATHAPLPPPPQIPAQPRGGDRTRTPAGPHPRAPPLPTHPHGTGLRGIPQARHRRRSPRPRHTNPRPLLRPRPQARPGTVVAALDPHAALGAAEVGPGRALPQGPGPSAPQGVGGELPPPAGGGVDAAGRMGSHAGRCAPPPGSPPPQPPRAPGPPVCPQAPAGDPPGNAARRHPPVGHHPKPSPARTHPLTTPQASAHRHRRHPQHPRSPARHTTRRA